MHQAKVIVRHEVGLHARPAAQFVKLAKQFKSNITITAKGKTVNAKSMVLLLTLAVGKNTEIEVAAEGEDEQEAVTALVGLVERNFEE
ncbi:HPr family phosphocarrier protein [Ktedonosporobacter rubrisoli]|uniref:Phosphocarrier protein HPr n=1 Tax=Ktedonosporobacter rubrisoli TaxID=2509675 RepID=A0A4P6JTA7_KTERU|nr:HPr family phosphocarrier protein [Ktedonosporobacter rubrisoli]QBD78533.1 HPr family phosphocarrier protein [Ktedonosporobacter rubrisoli]